MELLEGATLQRLVEVDGGAVAYYLLAGEDVFDGSSVLQLCIQHIQTTAELRRRLEDCKIAFQRRLGHLRTLLVSGAEIPRGLSSRPVSV